MSNIIARKRLFTETHRRRPHTGAPRPRLLGGQALAQAQRLSHPSMKPGVLGYVLFSLDALAIGLTGLLSAPLAADPGLTLPAQVWSVWLAVLAAALAVRLMGGYGFRRMRDAVAGSMVWVAGSLSGLAAVLGLVWAAGGTMAGLTAWFEIWAASAVVLGLGARLGLAARIRYLVRTGRM